MNQAVFINMLVTLSKDYAGMAVCSPAGEGQI